MEIIKIKNVSVRNIDPEIWDKAIHYRRKYGYDTVARFLEEAIESYCLRLDSALQDRKES